MTIPTDNVDEEMLARPSAWDIGFIRSFMAFFGPLSSIFDFVTFGVMLGVLHAHAAGVPDRLVRRVARDADAGDLRDPHPPPAVLAQPTEPRRSSSASLAVPVVGVADSVHAVRRGARVHAPAARVLPDPRRHGGRVPDPRRSMKGVFYRRHTMGAEPTRRGRPRHVRRIHRRAARFTARRPGVRAGRWLAPAESWKPSRPTG